MSDPFIIRIRSIEKVIDGDSVRVMADLGLKHYALVDIRVHRIDTPETSTDEGKLVRQYVQHWLDTIGREAAVLEIVSDKLDEEKFGRVLGDLRARWGNGETRQLGQVLLGFGMARLYNGDARKPWTVEELAETRRSIDLVFNSLGLVPDLPKPKRRR